MLRTFKYILVALLLSGCAILYKKAPEPAISLPTAQEALHLKYNAYRDLLQEKRDHNGWINSHDCDGLLFNGLLAATVFPDTKLEVAQKEPGQWFRRSVKDHGDCYPKESGSTVSRDMLLGLLWKAAADQNTEWLRNLWAYGEKNNWVMGKDRNGGVSTIMNPNMLSLLATLRYQLEGFDSPLRLYPVTVFANCENYTCHLSGVQVLLDIRLHGKTSKHNMDAMIAVANRNPNNPFFQYLKHKFTDGNYSKVIKLLLESSLYPATKLPTAAVSCEVWPIQREDADPSLGPCPGSHNKVGGGDFLFLSHLILGELNAT